MSITGDWVSEGTRRWWESAYGLCIHRDSGIQTGLWELKRQERLDLHVKVTVREHVGLGWRSQLGLEWNGWDRARGPEAAERG